MTLATQIFLIIGCVAFLIAFCYWAHIERQNIKSNYYGTIPTYPGNLCDMPEDEGAPLTAQEKRVFTALQKAYYRKSTETINACWFSAGLFRGPGNFRQFLAELRDAKRDTGPELLSLIGQEAFEMI